MNSTVKLLLILKSIASISFAQNSPDISKTVFAHKIDSMTRRLDSISNWAGNPTPSGGIIGYDAEASNYNRFKESPCFEKLGFSAFRRLDDQERMYQACESEYYKNLTIKIVSSLSVFGFIGYMIYVSLRRKKKTLGNLEQKINDL